jgi:Flp pilus assembly protein TadD
MALTGAEPSSDRNWPAHPARATVASLRCHGLLESDPDPLREAVAHYRALGPAVELPAALEDLAVALAERGRDDDARAAVNEAVSLYEGVREQVVETEPGSPSTAT